MYYNLAAILIFLLMSAFFSGSETSVFSLSKVRIKRLRLNNAKNSDTLNSLLQNPTDLLITILIGNMLANIFASSIAASLMMRLLGPSGMGVAIASMTAIVVIFCEIMPKIIAIKNAERISLFIAPFLSAFSRLVFPFRRVLKTGILDFFVGKVKRPEGTITKDELESAIKVGYSKGGILDKEEAEMMEDVIQMSDKKVEDVMVQGGNIVSFPVDMPVEEMCFAIREAELSRVPVYEGKPKNILGILYAKELLKKKLEPPAGADIRGILRQPFYVTRDMRLSSLLKEFRARRIHLALVNNEKGKLVGLVTLEDLLEEVIGDIRDKEALLQRIVGHSHLVGGNG